MSAHTVTDEAVLIGRGPEQELVAGLLAALREGPLPPSAAGGGRVLHLSGEPGTGKTALLRFAAATAAEQGVPVLYTAPASAERELRHAALHSLLHPRLPRLADLPAAHRAALRAAFGSPAPGPAPALLAAAALSLSTLTPGPVLLCVDDLDRIDPASRDTVREMARLCGGTGVGLIVTERAAPGTPPAPHARTVTLGPLPGPQARRLVARAGRATTYAEEELVLGVAGGNPLALTELSLNGTGFGEAAGIGMLPATPRLAQAYARDLEGMSPPARDLLLIAALSTSPAVDDVLRAGARLAGDGGAARAGLDEAVARGLIAESDRELWFPQPLLRVAVLRLESGARRMAAHAALGQSVTDPPRAAWHAAQCAAGADETLAARLETLADGPHPGTAVLPALAALERAAHLSPDPETRAGRLLRAAELASHHGLREQARRYARGLDLAELGVLGRAQLLWLNDLFPGNSAVGRERIGELCATARAVAGRHPGLAQKLLHAAAGRCWWQRAGAADRRTVVQTLEDLRPRPWDARDLVVLALTEPLSAGREPLPPASRRPGAEDRMLLGQVAHLTGDLQRAALLLQEAEEAVRAEGRHGRLPRILVARALGEVWLGTQWATAQALAEEGRATADRTGQADWAARACGVLGLIHALRGRHDAALRCAADVEEASVHLGQSRQSSLAALTRALAASGTGRYAEAYAQLRALFTERTTPYAFEQFWALAFLVEAALPAGEKAGARAVVEHVRAQTRTGRAPLLERVLAYAGAVLAEEGEAEDRYAEALGDGADQWPLLYAMTQFGHGAWLRRRRRLLESRGPLATAESVFRSLGAVPRADLAASELRATGQAEAGPGGGEAAGVLSPQQLTIARLAARGLSNRAIGEQLRLSPRTVASHLYQIFPKLGITSRAQLAERMDAY
ncbi:LuxR family transcriptional regulator [Streptomyces fumigatiscleroticus]|nr:LuxR family transcriptional regulator [Streptomyces fumigatiscleroticus]